MYTNFFGLSDIPFSIAPNPHYLFMSNRHREALAHLTHGLGDTGGFVLLTGEVGTGKTTISRCLLEQLPENTQVAFILNPTLSCLELLATICDELKIRYKKTGATLKYLTDKIQEKLLKNQKDNINTILIIDEAQHLQPEVLEELRLLTNLETNTKKLLQVILIGQPELQQLLQRRDLRQLAQRITARYHLLPLTKPEVALYIEHRISVADCHRALFNKQAISLIHKISQGIPRIINLLCDRALTIAYSDNQSVVGKKVIIQAAQQALGEEFHYKPWWQNTATKITAVIFSLVIIGGASFWLGQQGKHSTDVIDNGLLTNSEKISAGETQKSLLVKDNEGSELVNTTLNTNLPKEESTTRDISDNTSIGDIETVVQSEEKNEKLALSQVDSSQMPIDSPVIDEEPQQVISAEPKPPVKFDLSKVEGVSEALLARLESAVEESNQAVFANDNEMTEQAVSGSSELEDVKPLSQMPSRYQDSIPTLQFDMHIYASDGDGFVKVNGRDRYEGDVIATGVTLEKILPQKVILEYQGKRFSLPALSSW